MHAITLHLKWQDTQLCLQREFWILRYGTYFIFSVKGAVLNQEGRGAHLWLF